MGVYVRVKVCVYVCVCVCMQCIVSIKVLCKAHTYMYTHPVMQLTPVAIILSSTTPKKNSTSHGALRRRYRDNASNRLDNLSSVADSTFSRQFQITRLNDSCILNLN